MASKSWELEKDFQRWLRKLVGVWSSSVEYGLGGDAGFADMVIADPQGKGSESRYVYEAPYFIELKIGRLVDEGKKLVTSEVRPDQVAWHRGAHAAGIKCALFVGVEDRKLGWVIYPVRAELIKDWRDGYVVGKDGVIAITDRERMFSWLRANT